VPRAAPAAAEPFPLKALPELRCRRGCASSGSVQRCGAVRQLILKDKNHLMCPKDGHQSRGLLEGVISVLRLLCFLLVGSRIWVESHVPNPRSGQLEEEEADCWGCGQGWKQEGRTNGRKGVRGGQQQRKSDGAVSLAGLEGLSLPGPSLVAHRHLHLLSLLQASPCLGSSCCWVCMGRAEPPPDAVVDPVDCVSPFPPPHLLVVLPRAND